MFNIKLENKWVIIGRHEMGNRLENKWMISPRVKGGVNGGSFDHHLLWNGAKEMGNVYLMLRTKKCVHKLVLSTGSNCDAER